MLWLGHLEKEVHYAGHAFVIRTLKAVEEIDAGLIAREYENSFGVVKANAWAQLAAAIAAIDGKSIEEICPPSGPDKRQNLRGKFNYLTENWYWPVAAKLFEEYAELLREQAIAIEAVQDLSAGTLSNFWASSESSTGQKSSTATHQVSI